jgi:hypothetical protein
MVHPGAALTTGDIARVINRISVRTGIALLMTCTSFWLRFEKRAG